MRCITARRKILKQSRDYIHDGLGDDTVKPFNLAAFKVGDFTCKFVLAPYILVN